MLIVFGKAIDWVASREPHVVRERREHMIGQLEAASVLLKANGLHDKWFDSADPIVKQIAFGCNGHLFGQLLRAHGYVGWKCVEMLRQGPSFGVSS